MNSPRTMGIMSVYGMLGGSLAERMERVRQYLNVFSEETPTIEDAEKAYEEAKEEVAKNKCQCHYGDAMHFVRYPSGHILGLYCKTCATELNGCMATIAGSGKVYVEDDIDTPWAVIEAADLIVAKRKAGNEQ